ncbi:MAG: hypothetical protein WD066_15745 [Planctomycetaceae bacterium]
MISVMISEIQRLAKSTSLASHGELKFALRSPAAIVGTIRAIPIIGGNRAFTSIEIGCGRGRFRTLSR